MKYSNILVILACVLSTVLIAVNIQRMRAGQAVTSMYELTRDSLARKQVAGEHTIHNFFSFEGQVINQRASLQTMQQSTVPLKEIFSEPGYKLAFLLTDQQCDVCVEYVVGELDSLTRAQPSLAGKVVMLAGYDSWIQFSRYVKIKKINLPVYQFSKAEIDVPFTKLQKPTLMLLTNDLAARYVFIPDKSEPVIFGQYLHFAQKMLLSKM
jgi:hypothetical protein